MPEVEKRENRLRRFASFFKGYMGVMPLVTAAFAPVLTMLKAIPVYESQRSTLATYSGLLGFLLLAWVFYARRPFVRAMIPFSLTSASTPTAHRPVVEWIRRLQRATANILPLLLIVSSAYCFITYRSILDRSIDESLLDLHRREMETSKPMSTGDPAIHSRADVLGKWGVSFSVHEGSALEELYLGIFLFAELAFVIMALREYAYGVLKIAEADVLTNQLRCEVVTVE